MRPELMEQLRSRDYSHVNRDDLIEAVEDMLPVFLDAETLRDRITELSRDLRNANQTAENRAAEARDVIEFQERFFEALRERFKGKAGRMSLTDFFAQYDATVANLVSLRDVVQELTEQRDEAVEELRLIYGSKWNRHGATSALVTRFFESLTGQPLHVRAVRQIMASPPMPEPPPWLMSGRFQKRSNARG